MSLVDMVYQTVCSCVLMQNLLTFWVDFPTVLARICTLPLLARLHVVWMVHCYELVRQYPSLHDDTVLQYV